VLKPKTALLSGSLGGNSAPGCEAGPARALGERAERLTRRALSNAARISRAALRELRLIRRSLSIAARSTVPNWHIACSKPSMKVSLMALAWGAALAASNHAPADESAGALQTTDCVRAWGEARMRYPGYDHVVHLASSCSVEATCNVSTNVNPQTIVAHVPSGASVEVLTFMASPVREFAARVECKTAS
jgi:hypothetical protein